MTRSLLADAIHYCLHEFPAYSAVLHGRIHCYRAHASDDRTFIKAVAPHHAAIHFSHHAVNAGSGK